MLFERHTYSQRLLEIENYFIELCDGVSATQDKEATEEGAEEVGTVSRFGDSLEALFRVFACGHWPAAGLQAAFLLLLLQSSKSSKIQKI